MNEQLKRVYEEYIKMKKQPVKKKESFLSQSSEDTVIYEIGREREQHE